MYVIWSGFVPAMTSQAAGKVSRFAMTESGSGEMGGKQERNPRRLNLVKTGGSVCESNPPRNSRQKITPHGTSAVSERSETDLGLGCAAKADGGEPRAVSRKARSVLAEPPSGWRFRPEATESGHAVSLDFR